MSLPALLPVPSLVPVLVLVSMPVAVVVVVSMPVAVVVVVPACLRASVCALKSRLIPLLSGQDHDVSAGKCLTRRSLGAHSLEGVIE